MSTTPADIIQAIESAPYEAATEALLERYVATQLSSGKYDFVANKALLKSYQCHASPAAKLDVITDILVLSLMRMPSTDYLALSYLMPGGKVTSEKLALLQKYAELMEKSQYKEFWAEYAVSGASFANAVGFEGAVRECIVLNTSCTFRDVDMGVLAPMVGLEGAALKAFLASCKLIEAVTDNSVRFLPNDENTTGGKSSVDSSLKLDRMKQLFKLSA